jgi:ribose 5-phosphate isomerase A
VKSTVLIDAKKQVAAAAIDLLESGMVVGLGSGSTASWFIYLLGEKIRQGHLKTIVGVATSRSTADQAAALGIPLRDLADFSSLDIAVDGADEVDPALNLLKGWGGALVREKLVALHARRLVIVVDDRKLVERLGTRGPLPIEVIPFAWQAQAHWLEQILGCQVTQRQVNGKPYLTDNQNVILDCAYENGISDPYQIEDILANRPGVVGHGLFLDMASDILVRTSKGIKTLQRAQK